VAEQRKELLKAETANASQLQLQQVVLARVRVHGHDARA